MMFSCDFRIADCSFWIVLLLGCSVFEARVRIELDDYFIGCGWLGRCCVFLTAVAEIDERNNTRDCDERQDNGATMLFHDAVSCRWFPFLQRTVYANKKSACYSGYLHCQ